MASNMNHQIITNIEVSNTQDTNNTTVLIQEKSNVTQEEQDNINNMNANQQHSNLSTKLIDKSDNSNSVNNNHMCDENIKNGQNITDTNNSNSALCQSNGNVTAQLTKVPDNTRQGCNKTDDVPVSNALSDLMNTYSSDEDMFENFRSKQEFDDPKSEDELSSSTSFLSIHHESENSSEEEAPIAPKKSNGVKLKSTRNKGELDLDDLPPIEDLQISVPEDQCLPVGKILNIVDTLVLVKTLKNTPTLDLDSVLFLDKGGRSLGKIFDVIGPVCGPVYCVRFNSHKHIVDSNIHIDQDVYCAPQTEHTSYVPLPDLIKSKGSDASWEKDKEPPVEVVEFSDDEEERKVKRNKLRTRNNRNNQDPLPGDSEGPSEPKSQRPTPFEQRMNLRNLLMTASYERRSRLMSDNAAPGTSSSNPPRPQGKPYVPGNIIRAPTLPDIPPLPMAQPVQPRFTSPQEPPRFSHPHDHAHSHPPPLAPMHVFTPPPMFHQNKKQRPTTASPFSHPPRFSPPPLFNTPFTSLPPPPLFNDPVLLFTQPPGYPNPYTPPPPFQFGMPPLLGTRVTPPPPRYRQNTPRHPSMMRPAFGARHRF